MFSTLSPPHTTRSPKQRHLMIPASPCHAMKDTNNLLSTTFIFSETCKKLITIVVDIINIVNNKTLNIVLFSAAVCPRIQRIANGWVVGNGYLEGDTLSFRCERDYVLVGEHKITCTGNRRWTHRTPICKGWSQYVFSGLLIPRQYYVAL